ncbi:cytochrome-c peroxidase [Desulfuribacillus stibiiarsenatis]|uniref:Cytochrome-c peroxidase n=1 Tax=Desulfuribacillus stibiiarsenatis TaxID=1390249 RepID=A0A1E5L4J3_9FIRM|nr:cytochrome c peroxidase [Desulfuribacillus stibiiarsenatis]OEH85062.1 cytochrome-c peroxidase [Desulfuribacillus stibiiarsenatis]
MKKRTLLLLALVAVFSIATLTACGGTTTSTPAAAPEAPAVDPRTVFAPLGAMPIPEDNPMTDEKIELGKMLYFDKRLSGDDTISCASCHEPAKGWSDNRKTFLGFQGNVGVRNSPSIINSGHYSLQFWDGRMKTLEEQALGPIQDKGEMNLSLDELLVKLNAVPEYVERFQKVFNSEITTDGVAKAIAAFERTIVINDSEFDKWLAGDESALSAEAKEGMKLFVGKANCIQCHNGASLTDNNFHNVGIENDNLGRANFTKNPEDSGKYKTPALRGIGHTAPYMHNGTVATLEDVVEYFNKGGDNHTNKSVLIKPLNLSDAEKANLVAFLKSLNGTLPIVDEPTLP